MSVFEITIDVMDSKPKGLCKSRSAESLSISKMFPNPNKNFPKCYATEVYCRAILKLNYLHKVNESQSKF